MAKLAARVVVKPPLPTLTRMGIETNREIAGTEAGLSVPSRVGSSCQYSGVRPLFLRSIRENPIHNRTVDFIFNPSPNAEMHQKS